MSKLISIEKLAKLFLVLLLCAAPAFASAGREDAEGTPQAAGLMWNRTGLPAVFPLQVKTPAGQDYFLTLIDDETGEDALAAYIEGGAFFKVLVPPGVFRLSFAAGDIWQGEEELFGPGTDTHAFELKKPLTFRVRGLGTKAGHLVSLLEIEAGEDVQAAVKDQFICQSLRTEFPSLTYSFPEGKLAQDSGRTGWIKTRSGWLMNLDSGAFGREFAPDFPEYHFRAPKLVMWSQYCG